MWRELVDWECVGVYGGWPCLLFDSSNLFGLQAGRLRCCGAVLCGCHACSLHAYWA
jgi:hypothetical protein